MAYLLPQNPLPVSLPKECSKAAAILDAFANSTGLDGLIPPSGEENESFSENFNLTLFNILSSPERSWIRNPNSLQGEST